MCLANVIAACSISDMANVTVTITLPDVVYEAWKADKSRKGIIAKLVAEHYGFIVNKSRVVPKT